MYKFVGQKFVKISTRGSALIITLLIITVISAIGFGIGRLTIAEIKQSTRMEDSIAAESVAESGIEYGLLLYRYNHDVQLCQKDATNTESCDVATKNDGYPVTFNMGSDGNAKFELKIYYKTDQIGNPNNIDDPSNPILSQDTVIEIRGDQPFTFKYTTPCSSSVSSNPSDLLNGKHCQSDATEGSTFAHGVEIKGLDDTVYYKPREFYDLLASTTGLYVDVAKDDIVRIKPWNTGIRYAVQANSGTIDSGTTTIESTGYFGNTKRKLVTTINRASGSLLGIFDFVLYSGEGGIELK